MQDFCLDIENKDLMDFVLDRMYWLPWKRKILSVQGETQEGKEEEKKKKKKKKVLILIVWRPEEKESILIKLNKNLYRYIFIYTAVGGRAKLREREYNREKWVLTDFGATILSYFYVAWQTWIIALSFYLLMKN